jgi:hypothetical protein
MGQLTNDEKDACTQYYKDATGFHAFAQGWGHLHPATAQIFHLTPLIDSAIEKFEVDVGGTLYSGQNGRSVFGSLQIRHTNKLEGQRYCYPGFTSTSTAREHAESVALRFEFPVLFEIAVRNGVRALPMDPATGQCGESEVLLKRSTLLEIEAATFIDIAQTRVLELVLRLV